MKARNAIGSVGWTTGALAALTLAAATALAPQAEPQLSASDYLPSAAPPQPAPALPQTNAAPAEELRAPPRLLPPAEASPQKTMPTMPAAAEPPMASFLPEQGPAASSGPTFRDRWHHFMQSHFWGFPSQFRRQPLGYYVYQHGRTQTANGTAARMVLYEYDFVDGSAQLNPHGRGRLTQMAALLPQNFFPIVIERTPHAPALAEGRRIVVLNALAQGPFPVPSQRVVIGPSLGDDRRGVESQTVNMGIMMSDRMGAMMGAMMSMGGMGMGGMGMRGMGGMGMGGMGMGGMGMGGMGMGGMGMGGMGGMGMGGMGMGGMGMGGMGMGMR